VPWPKGKKHPHGKTAGSGRKAGSKNRRTREAEETARAIVDNPEVQAIWLAQAKAGELPSPILQTLMYYAWGKPTEHVDHSGTLQHIIEVTLE
jgi:hypothetical protein